MTSLQKVLWSEGLFIAPHHFQHWDRYHEDLVNFRLRALTTFMWGAEELKFNEEALENSFFELVRCRGVLPDGTPVDIPDIDPPPPSRIRALPPTGDRMTFPGLAHRPTGCGQRLLTEARSISRATSSAGYA
jgi:predicted component of type VI protein secretion system